MIAQPRAYFSVLCASAPLREALCVLVLWTTNVAAAEPVGPLRVVIDDGGKVIGVDATGWTKEELASFSEQRPEYIEYLSRALSMYVRGEPGRPSLPSIAGRYEVVGDAVRFIPRFSLRPGIGYQAEFFPPPRSRLASPARHTVDIDVPMSELPPPTTVTSVYPSSSTLPENQLRFYIHFSAPMGSGEAYDHIKLIRDDGKVITRAFLEIGEELWDGTGTRLTLLFDPGRVKTGLKPREEFGPVLEAGKNYRLVIDKGLRDANNQPLAENFEKLFRAGPMIEAAIDPGQWKIQSPPAGTRHPLIVVFPRPLDRALLMRMITVADSAGKSVSGDTAVTDEERKWAFTPEKTWAAGQQELVIDTALEDSAGNNLARPFEVDVFERVDKKSGPEFVRVPFEIR